MSELIGVADVEHTRLLKEEAAALARLTEFRKADASARARYIKAQGAVNAATKAHGPAEAAGVSAGLKRATAKANLDTAEQAAIDARLAVTAAVGDDAIVTACRNLSAAMQAKEEAGVAASSAKEVFRVAEKAHVAATSVVANARSELHAAEAAATETWAAIGPAETAWIRCQTATEAGYKHLAALCEQRHVLALPPPAMALPASLPVAEAPPVETVPAKVAAATSPHAAIKEAMAKAPVTLFKGSGSCCGTCRVKTSGGSHFQYCGDSRYEFLDFAVQFREVCRSSDGLKLVSRMLAVDGSTIDEAIDDLDDDVPDPDIGCLLCEHVYDEKSGGPVDHLRFGKCVLGHAALVTFFVYGNGDPALLGNMVLNEDEDNSAADGTNSSDDSDGSDAASDDDDEMTRIVRHEFGTLIGDLRRQLTTERAANATRVAEQIAEAVAPFAAHVRELTAQVRTLTRSRDAISSSSSDDGVAESSAVPSPNLYGRKRTRLAFSP